MVTTPSCIALAFFLKLRISCAIGQKLRNFVKFFRAENHEFFKGMCKHYEYYVLNIVYKFCLAVSDTFSKNNLHMCSPIFRVIAHAPILGIIYVGFFFLVLSKKSRQKSHQ